MACIDWWHRDARRRGLTYRCSFFFPPLPADLEEQAKEVNERISGLAGEHLETMRAARDNIKAALDDLSQSLYDVQQVRTHAHNTFADARSAMGTAAK